MDELSLNLCSLTSVVVRRRKETVDYQVIKQIEIEATLQPRGIFRARPIGSCCINSSLDLSLGSDGPDYPLLFLMTSQPFVAISQYCVTSRNFPAEQGVWIFSEFPLYFPAALRSVLAWLLFECKHQVMSKVPPHPLLSHELNHPAHDLPLPLPVSPKGEMTVTAQQALQWQLHGDPSAHSLLGARPLVIFSQPQVSRTCEMVQHLAPRRGCSLWDRYLICRSNVEADVGLPIVLRWSNIMKKKMLSLH